MRRGSGVQMRSPLGPVARIAEDEQLVDAVGDHSLDACQHLADLGGAERLRVPFLEAGLAARAGDDAADLAALERNERQVGAGRAVPFGAEHADDREREAQRVGDHRPAEIVDALQTELDLGRQVDAAFAFQDRGAVEIGDDRAVAGEAAAGQKTAQLPKRAVEICAHAGACGNRSAAQASILRCTREVRRSIPIADAAVTRLTSLPAASADA